MKLALYAHPFDLAALSDHGGLARLADLGYSELAVAASYHDGRWLQPWNDRSRVRFLEDGTVHYRPSAERDYGVLRPVPSSEVPESGAAPLEAIAATAPAAGLSVRAWTVFTHNSRLGLAHPDLCVQNAFGDRYVYGLCPAQPAVQDYVLAMVGDLAAHEGLAAIELEALGWMGWKHGSHHDKSSFQPRGMLGYALSLCFCERCEAAIAARGGDPVAVAEFTRDLIAEHIERGDAMAPTVAEDPEDVLGVARAARIETMRDFAARVSAVTTRDLAVQVHPDPLFAGSQLPAVHAGGLAADEFVITAYGEGPAAIERLVMDANVADLGERRLSIWPKAPQFSSDEDLLEIGALCREHGIGTVAIYHLGLLPWRTIERAARLLSA
ncbi:MAG: hypothetical protein NXI31_03650 [bacterium]|nr:hypothetical protein [bacterium]